MGKRAANSQSGRASKRPHVEKSSITKTKTKNSAAASRGDEGKKRSRPITVPLADENSLDEGDEEGSALDGAEEVWLDVAEDEEQAGEDEDMENDEPTSTSAPAKDLNAARESHKAQRALLSQRKASKPLASILSTAKPLAYALASNPSRKSSSAVASKSSQQQERERKAKTAKELMMVIKGNVAALAMKHDASRVVQVLVKHGGAEERSAVAQELKGRYVGLVQARYSKFLVSKLIRLCPAHRPAILAELAPHSRRLAAHREAARVLSDAFELYASAKDKAKLVAGFYGKEADMWAKEGHTSEGGRGGEKGGGLWNVLKGMEEARRARVMREVKENLDAVFNNPDKGGATNPIVHRVLWEYLQVLEVFEDLQRDQAENGEGARDGADVLRREMFETCADTLAEMVHTKDGSRAVRTFVAWGNAKDRKQIVKVLKPHVERIATDEEAQLVLFTLLDVVDDTKLLAKSLIQPLTAPVPSSLLTSVPGRRSLLYLLSPRSTRHVPPHLAETLDASLADAHEGGRFASSKKDVETRRRELRETASPGLVRLVEESGGEMAREAAESLVVGEVMGEAEGGKEQTFRTLLQPLAAPYPAPPGEQTHPIDLPHTARLHKFLLSGGHFSRAAGAVVPSPNLDSGVYAGMWMEAVGKERTREFAKGEGGFVVAAFIGAVRRAGGELRERVKGWFEGWKHGEGVRGAEVLEEEVGRLMRGE